MRILRIHLLVFSSFFVLCESGFNLLPCMNNPCQNGGVCNRQGALYVCMCAQNYTGVNCEINSGNRDRKFLEIEPLKNKRAINSEITRQNVLTTNPGINQTVTEILTTVEANNHNKTDTTTEENIADENEIVSNKNVTEISENLNLTESVSTESILNETVSNETETERSENLNVTTPVSSENKTKKNVTTKATEKLLTQTDLSTNRPAIVSVTTQTTARINVTTTTTINEHVTSNKTEKVGKPSSREQNVTTSSPVIERELTTQKTKSENKTSQVASPTKETGIHSITTTKTLTTRNYITNKTTIILLTTLEPTTKSPIKIPITSITTERTTKNFTALGAHNDTLVHVSAAVSSTTSVSPTTNTSETTTVPKKSSDNKLVVILVPIFACLLVIVVIIGTALFIRSARKKRATRGTYSPSRQEIYGAPRDLGDILKPPPEERLI